MCVANRGAEITPMGLCTRKQTTAENPESVDGFESEYSQKVRHELMHADLLRDKINVTNQAPSN